MSDPRLNGIGIGGPSPVGPTPPTRPATEPQATPPGRFGELLTQEIQKGAPLVWSAHAKERLAQRGIALTPELEQQLGSAMDLAKAKGSRSSLVITDSAAFVVSVPNRTVITAMDPDQMREKVVTNIDSAVIAPARR